MLLHRIEFDIHLYGNFIWKKEETMKKILLVLMTIILLISCKKSIDASSLLEESHQALTRKESYSGSIDSTLEMESEGEKTVQNERKEFSIISENNLSKLSKTTQFEGGEVEDRLGQPSYEAYTETNPENPEEINVYNLYEGQWSKEVVAKELDGQSKVRNDALYEQQDLWNKLLAQKEKFQLEEESGEKVQLKGELEDGVYTIRIDKESKLPLEVKADIMYSKDEKGNPLTSPIVWTYDYEEAQEIVIPDEAKAVQ